MLAAFSTLRTEDDLKFFLKVMVATMVGIAGMPEDEIIDTCTGARHFRAPESLAMYSVMIGWYSCRRLGPKFKGANLVLFGYLVCASIVQSALSRAALAMFAAGTISVIGLSLGEKPTREDCLSRLQCAWSVR